MLPLGQNKAHRSFYDSARHDQLFGEKETLLVHLAVATRGGGLAGLTCAGLVPI